MLQHRYRLAFVHTMCFLLQNRNVYHSIQSAIIDVWFDCAQTGDRFSSLIWHNEHLWKFQWTLGRPLNVRHLGRSTRISQTFAKTFLLCLKAFCGKVSSSETHFEERFFVSCVRFETISLATKFSNSHGADFLHYILPSIEDFQINFIVDNAHCLQKEKRCESFLLSCQAFTRLRLCLLSVWRRCQLKKELELNASHNGRNEQWPAIRLGHCFSNETERRRFECVQLEWTELDLRWKVIKLMAQFHHQMQTDLPNTLGNALKRIHSKQQNSFDESINDPSCSMSESPQTLSNAIKASLKASESSPRWNAVHLLWEFSRTSLTFVEQFHL